MSNKTARDVMVPLAEYPHARERQTLKEAIDMLETAQIQVDDHLSMPRILLVLDDDNTLIGMVRRRDILRGFEPEFHSELEEIHPEAHVKTEIDPNLSDILGPEDIERRRRKLERPVAEVVRELPGRVEVDDSLMRVVRELVGKDTHIAAVLENGKVLGVVRSLDLMRAVVDELA